MARSPKSVSRRAKTVLGTVTLLALTGCAADKSPGTPAFMQGCAAHSDTKTTALILRTDLNAPYFGCANESNLRAMADNPADLEKGRPLGPANGARESMGVETYQLGKNKPFGQTTQATPSFLLSGTSTEGTK